MKIIVFGLSISSAWGNGHATLLRGLFKSLHRHGHQVHFFERDTPYYASHRDAWTFGYADLHLYSNWEEAASKAKQLLADADVGVVTSYCADGVSACELVLESRVPRSVFYDMDTPVTLARLERGDRVPYLPAAGLAGFDLVLSYTGGDALEQLRSRLGARATAPLYGWVDPDVHCPIAPVEKFQADLSYLGTYSDDRQAALEALFIDAARRLDTKTFVIGGAMYPGHENWPGNVKHFDHVAPPDHSAFYCSSPLTLNITRASMARMGYCPSGRLFEAAACGTAVLSDWWEGLDHFFQPGEEIVIATSCADSISMLEHGAGALRKIGARARERTLDCHTAEIRARKLLQLIEAPVDERYASDGTSAVAKGA